MASIIQSHLQGGVLRVVDSENEMIKLIRTEEEYRANGCFINGTGACVIYCDHFLFDLHYNYI